MVDAPVKTSNLNCPDYMATHEEDYCTLNILEGTNMELKFYLDTVLQSTFTIAGKSTFTITGKSTFIKADNSSLLSILPNFTMGFCLSNSLVLTF